MKRTEKNPIPLAGYIPANRLCEIVRDAVRAMPKDEKKSTCKALIMEVIKWSSYSPEEAIGLLESTQFYFLQQAENIREHEELSEKRVIVKRK